MSVQPSPREETKIEEPAAEGEPLKPEPGDADHVAMEDTTVDQEQIEPRDQTGEPDHKIGPAEALVKPGRETDDDMDDAVCYHEGGDIFPEDVENHMAVLPEVEITMREVTIDDIVIIKANGVDIRLCIDYQVVNKLERLMVYLMPLINDLDLDKVLWYCSLDMASGFWVVSMTPRARLTSAFITPFGLFEWARIPFGLKNAPQIYQRIVDNALYGHMCIKPGQDNTVDVFEEGGQSQNPNRRSWGDDRTLTTFSRKVTYLDHQVSTDRLEVKPKDLEAFSNLPFPTKLNSMQPFLGNLNYYSRFIEDFAVYAAILYELREVDYYQVEVDWRTGGRDNPSGCRTRTLKANELNYGIVDKEGLDLFRMLDVCYSQLVTRSIKVLSRFSTLARLLKSNGLDGRLGRWAALLSDWTLEITKCSKGEDEIVGTIAASITPRAEVDEALITIAPKKQLRKMIAMIPPTVEPEESLLVESFDGSGRVKRAGGAYSAILWKLPEWTVLEAMSETMPDLTVNEAEYRGLLMGFDLLSDQARWRRKFLRVKRDWNQSADKLTSAALQREEDVIVTAEEERRDLTTLNRLHEYYSQDQPDRQRIKQAQDEEKWIVDLKAYLNGDLRDLSKEDIPKSLMRDEDRDVRLLVPASLQQDFLHHYHTSLEGGHQGSYVGSCTDCETGKGKPTDQGRSPGNVLELLIWPDLFTGYVIANARSSREAQAVAENYEECVFRRFGASGNGKAERTVQTLTRTLKMYVADVNQQDWDDYAERLTFALNTAQDRVRGDTFFYLVHGWDAR
ncbi:reverse transcriptase [Phytophthora megakarya]|uniref:Reverse transcriptase n=1 Tax=Phytophthora megakarya TaxID=4795 RepID=A0A225WJQ6_9STRA|nr:reverse transcriptase [Phytophthora megakarya]